MNRFDPVTLLIFVLLLSFTGAVDADSLECIGDKGELLNGQVVENGVCVDESVWYYALVPAPIASNGLQAGAPTHLHLQFGSIGSPVEDAFDPENYGLFIPGGKGNMTLELSPHFIYDKESNRLAEPWSATELGLGPANIIYPVPCKLDPESEQGRFACGGWDSRLGETKNDITVSAPDGLYGKRALEVGIKFMHIHPVIDPAIDGSIYHNANGTCDDSSATTYCRFETDCPNNVTCIPATEPLTASVTVTLHSKDGSIQHKATRTYAFDTEPQYAVYSTNTKLADFTNTVEMVDFQRVEPGTRLVNVTRGDGDFVSGSPYAPRFFLFAPNDSPMPFPQPGVDNVTAVLSSPTTGTILSKEEEIGSFELIQPEGANGELLEENLGFVDGGPGRIGGTLFAVPVKAGNIPGKSLIQVTLKNGRSAQSRFIVTASSASTAFRVWLAVPLVASLLFNLT